VNTRVLLNYEPVADGGYFARAVLLIEGPMADGLRRPAGGEPESMRGREPAFAAATTLSASNVHVAVEPGRDAHFIQMRHTFESAGSGNFLKIMIGDVYALDSIRIRLDALVGPRCADGDEAEVGQLVVRAHVRTDQGVKLRTVRLPLRLSSERGGEIYPDVCSMPISSANEDGLRVYTFGRLGVG